MTRISLAEFRRKAAQTDRDIAASLAARKAERDAGWRAGKAAAVKAETERKRYTRDELLGAKAIKTDTGWNRVVKVNAKTVSVATGYSWTDRVAFDKVLAVHRG